MRIKTQAEHTEWQIKEDFKELHQFLQDEEKALITALRKEEEQKKIPKNPFSVKEKLQKVRLELDWDKRKLSFCDAVTNKHLRTLTTNFTEKIFPFFYSHDETFPLKILPAKVVVGVQSSVLK
ncbi:hypothetical protein QQF64_010122 [Cirrhinus molitorella]|uniref:Uncharacterized protein n=1 Tax=Cirrhinus molitorella TaxID=172907 RepID=A0ABR3M3W8_9TELE